MYMHEFFYHAYLDKLCVTRAMLQYLLREYMYEADLNLCTTLFPLFVMGTTLYICMSALPFG